MNGRGIPMGHLNPRTGGIDPAKVGWLTAKGQVFLLISGVAPGYPRAAGMLVIGGAWRSRTALDGFAIHCITALLTRQEGFTLAG